jgi:imidazolonepropionase-like amidohydrolase
VKILAGTDYIAAGKTADLLLLRANPLEDIRNTRQIDAVLFNGNLYDRAALASIPPHAARGRRIRAKI